MGNDGGTIARRDDLVKLRGAPTAEDKEEDPSSTRQRWAVCGLSKAPLQEPVVADELGRWYNMDALLSHLLERKTKDEPSPDPIPYVRSLKDVTKLVLKRNPASEDKSSENLAEEEKPLPFICPLSSKVLSGAQRTVYLRTSGCAFAESALRAVVAPSGAQFPASGLVTCPETGKSFVPPLSWYRGSTTTAEQDQGSSDVVPLHPPEAEKKERLEALYLRRKVEKERKSKRKHRSDEPSEPKRSKRTHDE